MVYLVHGFSSWEISDLLCLSERTVQRYLTLLHQTGDVKPAKCRNGPQGYWTGLDKFNFCSSYYVIYGGPVVQFSSFVFHPSIFVFCLSFFVFCPSIFVFHFLSFDFHFSFFDFHFCFSFRFFSGRHGRHVMWTSRHNTIIAY